MPIFIFAYSNAAVYNQEIEAFLFHCVVKKQPEYTSAPCIFFNIWTDAVSFDAKQVHSVDLMRCPKIVIETHGGHQFIPYVSHDGVDEVKKILTQTAAVTDLGSEVMGGIKSAGCNIVRDIGDQNSHTLLIDDLQWDCSMDAVLARGLQRAPAGTLMYSYEVVTPLTTGQCTVLGKVGFLLIPSDEKIVTTTAGQKDLEAWLDHHMDGKPQPVCMAQCTYDNT